MNRLTKEERHCWDFASRQHLWQAVLWQQVMDAESNINRPPDRLRKGQARDYLTSNLRDFRLVCQYAGFDPDVVHERFLKRFPKEVMFKEMQTDLPLIEPHLIPPIQDFLFDVQPFTLSHCRKKRHAARLRHSSAWVQQSFW